MTPELEAKKAALIAALRDAGSMTIIEMALDEATCAGDTWPQNTDGHPWPNPSFTLAIVNLLRRDPKHAMYASRTLIRETDEELAAVAWSMHEEGEASSTTGRPAQRERPVIARDIPGRQEFARWRRWASTARTVLKTVRLILAVGRDREGTVG